VQAKKDISDIHADLGRDGLLEAIQSNVVPIESVPTNRWADALAKAIVSSSELESLSLTPRRKLLGDFFCEGDLGFIYAFRGVGKTWMALMMARALAEGGTIGPWRAPTPKFNRPLPDAAWKRASRLLCWIISPLWLVE